MPHTFSRTRLTCLPLESRLTPAVLDMTVDTAVDVVDPVDGVTSLREAITQANTQTAYDSTTIRFALALTGATVPLATGVPTFAGTSAFEIATPRPITLEGNGQKLSASGSFRLFAVGAVANLSVKSVEFLNGTAPDGGAVYNLGTFTATACTFTGNSASQIQHRGMGGAIYNRGGIVTLDNCTVTNNAANGFFAGRTFIGGAGGGIYNEDGTLTLNYVTIADNTADRGTGQQVYSRQVSAAPIVRIDHSILTQANPDTPALVVTHTGSSGVGNLVRGFTGFGGQVILNVDPLLGPLQDNGGPTRTRSLAANSPALDVGELFTNDLRDQTGALRGGGAFTDLGSLEFRATRPLPLRSIYVGSGPGGRPLVKKFDNNGNEVNNFAPYDITFTGGVHVAQADFNRDGVPDIVTAAGPGGGPHVKVFDGVTGAQLLNLFAFDVGFRGGVSVAAADLSGDGIADLIVGAGAGGGPHVRVLDGNTGAEIRSFFAYSAAFTGGVNVAYGNGWIITGAGPGAGPHVKAFDATTGAEVRSFYAYDPGFTGGVNVAAADVNRIPSRPEPAILTGAGAGGGTNVRMFDGTTGNRVQDWIAFPSGSGAVSVAIGDLTSDGFLDLIVGSGTGDLPRVRVLRGQTATEEFTFTPFADTYHDGVFVG